VIDVLANDTDPDGDTLTVTSATATNGTVTVNPDGTLTYTPNADYNGPDTISYTVDDGNGGSATSTVTVTVNPVNDAPVAVDDAATTPFNTAVVIDVVGNDTDVDGDTLSVLGTPTSADGTVAVNPDGTITFTPTAGFTGVAVIDYTVTDPEGLTDTAQVLVTVGAPVRDGIVTGTAGDDLIDIDYVDPTDGDRIDAGDAIIPGDGPNDDRVVAGDGNDTVRAGEGNDLVFGGDGDDLITGDEGIPLPDRGYPGLYPADTDPFNNRDTLFGGAGNDSIFGGDDNDVIDGGDGDDLLDGGVDDDSILGGAGSDTIIGGEGSDTIEGNDGDDLIYGGLSPAFPDEINIPDVAGDLVPDNGRDLIYGGAGNDTIFGMDDNDSLYGGDGDDVIDGGVDNDVIFGDAGNDTLTGGQGADTLFGGADRDLFVINATGDGAGSFVDGGEEGDDFDTLDLRGAGPLRVTFDADNVENGIVTYFDADRNVIGSTRFVNIENVVPCFTPGTLIATPRGEVPVESLKEGDRVITRDNGIQEIRWVGRRDMTAGDFAVAPHLRPVLVRKGALGNGLPERDMMVSPNHRLLVANDRTALYFDEHEVLVAAKHLLGGEGIRSIQSSGTAYIHFLCDRHEVVLSNGAWTETFQPGDQTLKGMGNAQRSEIYEIFPELKTPAGVDSYAAARKTLKRHEALLLAK
jgi:Ca2+-binding RTX toxin-like protein